MYGKIFFIGFLFAQQLLAERCTTPNGEEGECRFVYHCPPLLKYFIGIRNSTEAYLSEFICEPQDYHENKLVVCCVMPSNNLALESDRGLTIPPKFLERERCGIQHRDDYFTFNNLTIDEFPWMALIQQTDGKTNCAGTLINSRYVLTTITCTPTYAKDIVIRLGAYGQFNNTDCVFDTDVAWEDCSVTQKIGVEEIVRHPFYIQDDNINLNDISLLRLSKTVTYSDFIRPICLPGPATITAKVDEVLYMATWSDFQFEDTDIKSKVPVSLITDGECQQKLKGRVIHLGIMCASELNYEDDRYINNGGALMFHNDFRWHIEGLALARSIKEHVPLRFINVSKYVDWIVENMRPWRGNGTSN